MQFKILGGVEVWNDSGRVPLPAGKQRSLLAVLLLNANHVVSAERLQRDLWGDDPPLTAANALQVHVAGLRALLEPDRAKGGAGERLVTREPGYLLRVDDSEFDVIQFERLVASGREHLQSDPRTAARLLREALAIWRGPALHDVADAPFAAAQASRLGDVRLGAIESVLKAELAVGHNAEVLSELGPLLLDRPYHEGLRAVQILALYRSGRQVDALEVARDTRRLMAEELGLEPGPELQDLERAILQQDPALTPARNWPAGAGLFGRNRRRGVIFSGGIVVAVAVLAGFLILPRLVPSAPGATMTTLAGGGSSFPADGVSATSTSIQPTGVAVARNGTIYFADGNRVRILDHSGKIQTVAGTGSAGYSGDGGSARLATFTLGNIIMGEPSGIAVDDGGSLYVADSNDNRIRKVSPEGIITTIAGNGVAGFSGDGDVAVNAELNSPHGLALDRAGDLFVADTGNNRVRKVAGDGTITTVAGTGHPGFSGDGGPAGLAQLDGVQGLCADPNGNLYVADTNNERVRQVTTAGKIVTIAGDGRLGGAGDGGKAVAAELALPVAVACGADGVVYVADSQNNRIRSVDTNGGIASSAGNGTRGFGGDGASPEGASLDRPLGVAIDPSGALVIADSGNDRIRRAGRSRQ